MALSSTIYNFDIELSNVDRAVYQTLALRVARHPSETEEYLLTRVLAYCLEYEEGICFSRGVSEADEPAVMVRDLTGAWRAWIEVGSPDAARLHKAGKLAPRVVVYTHREMRHLLRQLAGERIHRAEALELYGVDPALLAAMIPHLDRRTALGLSVTDGHLYVTLGEETWTSVVERHRLG